jgi:hypothetical protein
MGVNVSWLDAERTILIYELYGKWTWDAFYLAFEQALTMMAGVPHIVYALTIARDEAARHHIPPNILTHFPIITRRLPANAGAAVMVVTGFNPIWRSIYNAVVKLYPPFGQRVTPVSSEAEGLARIARYKTQDTVRLGA